MSDQASGDIAELADHSASFTDIGIAVACMWIVVPAALRFAQFV